MMPRVQVDRLEIPDSAAPQHLFAGAGGGDGEAEHFADGSTQHSIENHGWRVGIAIESLNDPGRRNSSLPIRRSGQGHQLPFAGDEIPDFDHIAYRPDVRIAGAHGFIDANAAQRPQLQTACLCQRGFGPHADPQDHQVGVYRFPLGGSYGQASGRTFRKSFDALAQPEHDALFPQAFGGIESHLRIQRRQYLVGQLQQGDFQAAPYQVLGHFQSDEAASHQHRTLGLGDGILQFAAVGDGTQDMDSGQVDAGQGRSDRPGARRQDQRIIGIETHLSRFEVPCLDQPADAVDAGDLGLRSDFDVEAILEQGGCRHQQLGFRLDDIAHEVRQTAIGEGYMRSPIEQDDLAGFAKTPGTRRTGGAAGHAADDEEAFLAAWVHDPPPLPEAWRFSVSQDWSMPWVSISQTDSSHMALMKAKAAAKPTPSIQVKYPMNDSPL